MQVDVAGIVRKSEHPSKTPLVFTARNAKHNARQPAYFVRGSFVPDSALGAAHEVSVLIAAPSCPTRLLEPPTK